MQQHYTIKILPQYYTIKYCYNVTLRNVAATFLHYEGCRKIILWYKNIAVTFHRRIVWRKVVQNEVVGWCQEHRLC